LIADIAFAIPDQSWRRVVADSLDSHSGGFSDARGGKRESQRRAKSSRMILLGSLMLVCLATNVEKVSRLISRTND
jgi:hypothetical protein